MKQWFRSGGIAISMILLIIASLSVLLLVSSSADETRKVLGDLDSANESFVVPEGAFKPPSYEMRLLFGGDVMWGRQIERAAIQNDNEGYGFAKLSTLNRGSYDGWIVNVECPITDAVIPFDVQWEAITFNCPPAYVDDFAEWFDVASLANNHTDNINGQTGLDTTRANLEQAGVQHFGHFDPNVKDELCEIVSLPVRISTADEVAGQFPIALCGYHGVFQTFTDEQLAVIEDYATSFITFVMPHAGAEYQPDADELRRSAYRKMIDYGADAVFGNHPHWVQETESYKGKPIIYSMGNFIFDQQFSPEVTRSAMIDVRIDIAGAVRPWLELAEQCAEFGDSCVELASNLSTFTYDIAYDVVGTTTENFQTRRASQQEQTSIIERMNWRQTQASLQ